MFIDDFRRRAARLCQAIACLLLSAACTNGVAAPAADDLQNNVVSRTREWLAIVQLQTSAGTQTVLGIRLNAPASADPADANAILVAIPVTLSTQVQQARLLHQKAQTSAEHVFIDPRTEILYLTFPGKGQAVAEYARNAPIVTHTPVLIASLDDAARLQFESTTTTGYLRVDEVAGYRVATQRPARTGIAFDAQGLPMGVVQHAVQAGAGTSALFDVRHLHGVLKVRTALFTLFHDATENVDGADGIALRAAIWHWSLLHRTARGQRLADALSEGTEGPNRAAASELRAAFETYRTTRAPVLLHLECQRFAGSLEATPTRYALWVDEAAQTVNGAPAGISATTIEFVNDQDPLRIRLDRSSGRLLAEPVAPAIGWRAPAFRGHCVPGWGNLR